MQLVDAALAAAGLKSLHESAMGRVTTTGLGERIRLEEEPFGGFPARDSPPPPALPPLVAFFYTPDRWVIDGGPADEMRGQFLRDEAGGIAWLRLGGRLHRRV